MISSKIFNENLFNKYFPKKNNEESRSSSNEKDFSNMVGITVYSLDRIDKITNCSCFKNSKFLLHLGCGYCGRKYNISRNSINYNLWIGFDFRFDQKYKFMLSINCDEKDLGTICTKIANLYKSEKKTDQFEVQYCEPVKEYWINIFFDINILLEDDTTIQKEIDNLVNKIIK